MAKVTLTSLQKRGAKYGLDGAWVAKLVEEFGPKLAEVLISVLVSKLGGLKLKAGAAADNWLKTALLSLLTNNRDTVIGWIEQGEEAVFDAFVAVAAAKAPILARLLARFKQQVLSETEQETVDLIDQLIALLEKSGS